MASNTNLKLNLSKKHTFYWGPTQITTSVSPGLTTLKTY